MHYKNGREAKQGDMVIHIPVGGGSPVTGILFNLQPSSGSCNGSVVPTFNAVHYITVGDCLHVEDISKASIPDQTKAAEALAD